QQRIALALPVFVVGAGMLEAWLTPARQGREALCRQIVMGAGDRRLGVFDLRGRQLAYTFQCPTSPAPITFRNSVIFARDAWIMGTNIPFIICRYGVILSIAKPLPLIC
ncbi:hypothetical protein, partial [Phytopseudomonas daroniae]|uniref:hypothetical protein n=1 Tax=Phytopseudomonas daroniae TaxID=2487519 RepID=UPI001F619103